MKKGMSLQKMFSIIFCIFCMYINGQEPYVTNKYIEKAKHLTEKNIDSAVYYLNSGIDFYRKENDTLNLINSICQLSALYSNILDYGKSYDGYWDALILADLSNDNISKSMIYRELGWLYNSYRREEESLDYFNKSLRLKKELVKENKIGVDYLVSNYYAIVNCYRINNNLKMAKVYLDSCMLSLKKISPYEKSFYVESEAAYYNAVVKGNYNESLSKLNNAKEFFEKNDPSYLTVIYYLFGEIYTLNGDTTQAINSFKNSLSFSEKYNKHLGYKLFNYNILSKLYSNKGNYKEAFEFKKKAEELNEKIFGLNSKNNKHLIEIKDKYRLQKEKELEMLNEAKIQELESQKRISFLRNILMAAAFVFLLLYGMLFFRNLRRKNNLEKEKINEVMKLKNRELTTSVLQLIEKEEFIIKLKNSIAKNDAIDVRAIHSMVNSFQNSIGDSWKEFETRFISVNQNFYKNMRKKYPNLSQTDLKLCALLKLGFSSKEMSSLLGITIESAHTSRYRLRKKLNLEKGTNLAKFMANF
ncbi:tetratricopeptide repeat protein [uncultured Maribacter sp.]|uniref:tetratricopeptide repeat protein n=1 Tax=uncultured Maribacter sp. TaxID=431308 RepID=UPI002621CAE2|nr:tetratricopeptide repeat protein [uncultured Maribacter sp.]